MRQLTFIGSCVNLVKIRAAITSERVNELGPNFFSDFRIKERTVYSICIYFVPLSGISYTFVSAKVKVKFSPLQALEALRVVRG
jgi:hypothetical protein